MEDVLSAREIYAMGKEDGIDEAIEVVGTIKNQYLLFTKTTEAAVCDELIEILKKSKKEIGARNEK